MYIVSKHDINAKQAEKVSLVNKLREQLNEDYMEKNLTIILTI